MFTAVVGYKNAAALSLASGGSAVFGGGEAAVFPTQYTNKKMVATGTAGLRLLKGERGFALHLNTEFRVSQTNRSSNLAHGVLLISPMWVSPRADYFPHKIAHLLVGFFVIGRSAPKVPPRDCLIYPDLVRCQGVPNLHSWVGEQVWWGPFAGKIWANLAAAPIHCSKCDNCKLLLAIPMPFCAAPMSAIDAVDGSF